MENEERVREMLCDVGVRVEGDELRRISGLCAMLDGFAEQLRAVDVGDAAPATVFSVRAD